MKIKAKAISLMLTLMLILSTFASAGFTVGSKEVKFSDFADTHWAYNNVKVLVEEGAVGGYPDGTFRPSGTITNAEFMKIAMVQAGFDGVGGNGAKWYSPYVDFAYDKGIIEKGIFSDNGWNKPITRDKMCYVIVKVGEYLGEDFTYTNDVLEGMNTSVTDVKSMSEPYKTCVYKALTKGIVTGYANNKHFEPSWNATRAEASAMLSRLTDKTLRVATHFVSTVVKVDKDFINKMDKKWQTPAGYSPADSYYFEGEEISLKSFLEDFIYDKVWFGEKAKLPTTIYYDKENECGCIVCPHICFDAGVNRHNGFFAYADKDFFKQRGTLEKVKDGYLDSGIETYYFYKDGRLDASVNLDTGGYGQDINNIDIVVFIVNYTNTREVWICENPTILDYQTEAYKALTTYAWWR